MEGSRFMQSRVSTPIKSSNIDHLEQDKKYILKKLHYLFVAYSARASRYAYKQINQKYFMELMTDIYEAKYVRLAKNSQAWKKIVTLYHSRGKKSGMDYESFLKLLPAISQLFSRCQTTEDQLKCLLKHLIVVYQSRVAKQIENKYVEFQCQVKPETCQYLQKLQSNLRIIYQIYFPEQINNISSYSEQSMADSFDRIVHFFRQFQVYPKIISASQLYLIFMEIITNEQYTSFSLVESRQRKAQTLSYKKFILILLQVAVVSISRLREVQDPEWWIQKQKQCLKALFEYMEGVRTKSKNSKFQNIRFSFILYEQYAAQKEMWMSIKNDPQQMKYSANKIDFFDMFERMKL